MSTNNLPFPNYVQIRQPLPLPVWHGIRLISVGVTLGICLILFIRPDFGLFIFWRVLIPMVPLLFFVAPGIWRNICPMAALNQTPRLFQFSRALTVPVWFKEYGYVIGIALFLLIAGNRKALFNESGPATALVILALLVLAFIMGIFFKGKSGWCSSICPLLPIQRIYGQTPFVTIPNSHCQPCVGCTKNCYDFNPKVAYLADLYDEDRHYVAYRKFFVGLFPGFILGFYTIPNPPEIGLGQMYALFVVYCLVSAGTFFLLDSFVKVSSNKITVIYGAVALNLYYWFNGGTLGTNLLGESAGTFFGWAVQATVLILSLIWIARTYQKEPIFVEYAITPRLAQTGSSQSIVAHRATQMGSPELRFEPEGKRVVVKKGRPILEIAESNGLPIEAGCRMGVCGADPVCILKGMENLSKMGSDERTTIERLALGENIRMACVARVNGNVTVSLKPEKPKSFNTSVVAGFKYDKSVKSVVIIGNGIAGVTAADHLRRRHLTCDIHLVGRESHHLYNRMAITRLIYGRSAMQGLYLLPDKWYDDNKITTWLNTEVKQVDPQAKEVTLGTGEKLKYDRLILTTGSASFVPAISGYGLPGSYVLRAAEDAIAIRAYVQKQECRQAIIAGGGLLGLEAAYALYKLGLRVSVLERSDSLLKRQLDERGGQFLRRYLEGLGIQIVTQAEAASVSGSGRLQKVTLKDGRELVADLLLVCAGIQSHTQLAQQIGLKTKRGILVNDQMQTSHPDIYAAGDAAEFNGQVLGLWTVATGQGETAAVNAIGGNARYKEIVPVTMLKVVGVDLTSIGKINPESEQDQVIALEDLEGHRYRKLVIRDGKIVGAILLGYPLEATGVAEAAKQELDVRPFMKELSAGNWQPLTALIS